MPTLLQILNPLKRGEQEALPHQRIHFSRRKIEVTNFEKEEREKIPFWYSCESRTWSTYSERYASIKEHLAVCCKNRESQLRSGSQRSPQPRHRRSWKRFHSDVLVHSLSCQRMPLNFYPCCFRLQLFVTVYICHRSYIKAW